MNKSKLSVILDALFISFLSTFLLYCWNIKIIKNAIFLYFICILMFLSLFIGLFVYFNKKYNLNKIKLFEQKNALNYIKFFTYSNTFDDKIYFEKLLEAKYISHNIYQNDNAIFYINLKSKLTDEHFNLINNFKIKNNQDIPFIIIANNISEEFMNLIQNSPQKYYIENFNKLYSLMKSKNFFPTTFSSKQKTNFFKRFYSSSKKTINSHNFFRFLLSGISLILISIYIPFSSYYMIFGSIFLILAIISLFNKQHLESDNLDLISLTKKTDSKI